jgi:5-methylcytosine-specific restriction endonuclease McrA
MEWDIEAKRLRDEGLSQREIGLRLGHSQGTVSAALNREASRAYMRQYMKEYRRTHPEVVENAREKSRARTAKWRTDHPGYQKQWEIEHPGYFKEWGESHRKERAEAASRYAKRHPDRVAAYRDTHKAEHTARQNKRRAREIGTMVAGTEEQMRQIYRAARSAKRVRCYLCGKFIQAGQRHVDHVVPLSKGGAHAPHNLAIAHASCNERKAAKMPEEVGVLL